MGMAAILVTEWIIWTNILFPHLIEFPYEIGLDWPSGLWGEDVWRVSTMEGRTTEPANTISSPMSLRLTWAKNEWITPLNGFISSLHQYYEEHSMSPDKRICVFEHSVMTNFNCACPAIQRGQRSGFLSEGSSWFTASMSEQRRFWRDCADAQARLNLRCSHRR